MVGATKIIFPHREAAKRITPLLVSSGLLNYLPVSGKLVIAEILVPERLFGISLLDANLRRSYGVNLISVKNGEDEEYGLFTPEYSFKPGDIALVSGMDKSVELFAESNSIKKSNALDCAPLQVYSDAVKKFPESQFHRLIIFIEHYPVSMWNNFAAQWRPHIPLPCSRLSEQAILPRQSRPEHHLQSTALSR